jgi:MurNAc alpha-1-phosphate uridylyltransferase
MIDTLLIFAAGFGKRMGAITQEIPKSLIKINGKPILYYVLESALRSNFKQIIINTHYKAEQINAAVSAFNNSTDTRIILLHEPIMLETGGAVKNALKYLDQDIVATAFSDTIVDSSRDYFVDMQEAWDPQKMDILFLLHEVEKAVGYTGAGDFDLLGEGQVYKPEGAKSFEYMNAGSLILKPSLIAANPKNTFSLAEHYHGDRLYGIVNQGDWYHVSCPEDITETEKHLSKNAFSN